MQDHPDLAREGLQDIIEQFIHSELHPPEPLHVHDISKIEQAFRVLQERASASKVVVDISPKSEVLVSTSLWPITNT